MVNGRSVRCAGRVSVLSTGPSSYLMLPFGEIDTEETYCLWELPAELSSLGISLGVGPYKLLALLS